MELNGGTFAVIGGDLRSAYAALALIGEGRPVRTAGLERSNLIDPAHSCAPEQALAADFILLPLPLLDREGRLFAPLSDNAIAIRSVMDGARPGERRFAGRVPPEILRQAADAHLRLEDYSAREEFQRLNAVPTAEGALELLMRNLPGTVRGSKILVIGFGRTAQSAALLFKAVGAEICVCARKTGALAHANSLGMRTMPLDRLKDGVVTEFDAAVNTVPAPVLTAEVLSRLRPGCFVLDLASAPGGTDFDFAKQAGINARLALALPGKVAPKTAGEIIRDTVLTMIEERGQVL